MLERELKKLASYVLKKHGYLPEIGVFDLDGGSEQTTTFGGTQSAVDVLPQYYRPADDNASSAAELGHGVRPRSSATEHDQGVRPRSSATEQR